MSLPPPVPETIVAILPHGRTGVPTLHRYVTSVPVELPDRPYVEHDGTSHVLAGGPAWSFIFESQEADPALRAQRRWGLDVSRRSEDA